MDFAFPNSFIFSVNREKYVSNRFFKFSFCSTGTPSKLSCGGGATLIEHIDKGGMIKFLVSFSLS